MTINMQGINLFGGYGLKSTQEKVERQAKRDNQIAFFEQQKENLKNMKGTSLDEIAKKLELLQNYNDQIEAAKTEYNNSQMQHILDEAIERGEKIAEAAEKYEPKTPEERREDMIEEATGIEKDEGMLSEIMEEMDEVLEEMSEETLEEISEETEELVAMDAIDGNQDAPEEYVLPEDYTGIDYRV